MFSVETDLWRNFSVLKDENGEKATKDGALLDKTASQKHLWNLQFWGSIRLNAVCTMTSKQIDAFFALLPPLRFSHQLPDPAVLPDYPAGPAEPGHVGDGLRCQGLELLDR